MKRALAIAVLCTVLLTGCGRAAKRGQDRPPAPPATTSTSATTDNGVGSGGTGKTAVTGGTSGSAADGQIASTDGLLGQLDNQVDADAQPAQDAD